MAFDRITYSGKQPIEHAYSWFRADRYKLHVTLARRGPHRFPDHRVALLSCRRYGQWL